MRNIDPQAAANSAVIQVQCLLRSRMEQEGVDRHGLALRMGADIHQVDRMFSPAAADMNLAIFAEAAHALGAELDLRLEPLDP